LRNRPGVPGLAFIDFLANLLLVFTVLFIISFVLIRPQAAPPALRTPGVYAVEITWPGRIDDDVDLYVRDPQKHVVYFANPTAGLLHLEHDDLGYPSASTSAGRLVKPRTNVERVVLRGVETGEFVANVHLYRGGGSGPVRVHAALWKLIGADKPITSVSVVLRREGDERTAFRFTVTPGGEIANVNRLPADLVRAAVVGTSS
jgi:hypothetical protein